MEIIIQFNDLVAERQAFEIQIYEWNYEVCSVKNDKH